MWSKDACLPLRMVAERQFTMRSSETHHRALVDEGSTKGRLLPCRIKNSIPSLLFYRRRHRAVQLGGNHDIAIPRCAVDASLDLAGSKVARAVGDFWKNCR